MHITYTHPPEYFTLIVKYKFTLYNGKTIFPQMGEGWFGMTQAHQWVAL